MRKLLSLAIISFLLVSCNSKTENVTLNLKKGETYKHASSGKSIISQNIRGNEMTISMTTNGILAYTVKDIQDNNYILEAEYENIKMIMEYQVGTVEFDSEKNDPNDKMSTMLSKVVGQKFDVIIDQSGKIKDVKNMGSIWDSALSNIEGLSPQDKQQMKSQMEKSYGTESFKSNIEPILAVYPESGITKGQKWTINRRLESLMSADVITEYECTELTDEYAIIKGVSTLKTDGNGDYVKSNGVDMKYDVSGTMSTDIKVDRKTGWLINSTITQDFSGEAQIKKSQMMPEGMTIPLKISVELNTTN